MFERAIKTLKASGKLIRLYNRKEHCNKLNHGEQKKLNFIHLWNNISDLTHK